jgi:hypothetical protein
MTTRLAYLDHNVLDRMSKGDPDDISPLLRSKSLIPVFSQETLQEIRRSSGHEDSFLKLLERIGALYLVPLLDERGHCSGQAEARRVNPLDAYNDHLANVTRMPELGFGLPGILQKFYGGRTYENFDQILSGGAEELRQLLEEAHRELERSGDLNERDRQLLETGIAAACDVVRDQSAGLATLLDSEGSGVAAVKQFEVAMGLGPKVLNNLQPPDVVRQIWAMIETKIPAGQLDLETFFNISSGTAGASNDRKISLLEKVNAIYHQLNFVGYCRDSQMHKRRRFAASFSDLTHAGLASFCHALISGDEALVMKTAAAYEYLNVGTQIIYYRAN